MSRQKLASAYVASQQISALSKMDFSSEKTAGITMDDVEAYLTMGAFGAPESRFSSRLSNSLGGSTLGSLAGALAAQRLAGGRGITELAILGGLGGGLHGFHMSREADPLHIKALRELGLPGYQG
jgi:hypothetical protein